MKEVALAKRTGVYRSEKRKKEMTRQKKQEEKDYGVLAKMSAPRRIQSS